MLVIKQSTQALDDDRLGVKVYLYGCSVPALGHCSAPQSSFKTCLEEGKSTSAKNGIVCLSQMLKVTEPPVLLPPVVPPFTTVVEGYGD